MSSVPFLSSPVSGDGSVDTQVRRRPEKRTGGYASVWVRGLGRVFARVALFRIEGTVARLVAGKRIARSATGDGISLLDQTPLRWAVEAASPIVGAGRGPGGLVLPALLGLAAPRAYAVIPLVVARKMIALAYVDNADKPLPVGTVGELFAYCNDVLNGSAERQARRAPRIRVQSTARRPGTPTRRKPGFVHARRAPQASPDDASNDSDDTVVDAVAPFAAGERTVAEGTPLARGIFDIHDIDASIDALGAGIARHASPAGIAAGAIQPVEGSPLAPAPFDIDAIAARIAADATLAGEGAPRAPFDIDADIDPRGARVAADAILPGDGSPLGRALFDIDALAARIATEPDRIATEPDDVRRPHDNATPGPVQAVPTDIGDQVNADLVVTPQGVVSAKALRRRRLPRFGRRLLGTAAALAATGVLVTAPLLAPVQGAEGKQSIEIPPSASLDQIAADLTEQELIRSPTAFKIMARLTGLDRSLRAGTYELARGTWTWSVLAQLHRGQVHTAAVTLPEGSTLREVAAILERKGLASSSRFLRAARDRELLTELGIHAPTAEGFLFPETYTFAAGLDEREILRALVGEFFRRLGALPGGERLRGERLLETVILASIVEREARVPEEQARIAGVFQNRVERNMRLESCATVQYIIGDPKARLRNDDLRIESPYNTYLNEGLPPGPIANPGAGALTATLNPEDHDYLFFVAREDGSGRHTFTRTFADHQAAQRQIRHRGR